MFDCYSMIIQVSNSGRTARWLSFRSQYTTCTLYNVVHVHVAQGCGWPVLPSVYATEAKFNKHPPFEKFNHGSESAEKYKKCPFEYRLKSGFCRGLLNELSRLKILCRGKSSQDYGFRG